MPPDHGATEDLLKQARFHTERVLSHLQQYARSPGTAAGETGGAVDLAAAADLHVQGAADAARRLLLDIVAALDKVPVASSDLNPSPGGPANHD